MKARVNSKNKAIPIKINERFQHNNSKWTTDSRRYIWEILPECDVALILRPLTPETKVKSREQFTHLLPSRAFSFELRVF